MPHRIRNRLVADPLLLLAALLAAALATRLVARFAFGEAYFWTNGYQFYYRLAENAVGGRGLCVSQHCAWFAPLYSLFLTVSVLTGGHLWLIVVPQAFLGAGTALCAYLIGREIFDLRVGLLACAVTAFYPYYVMHDTALQETSMVTFCTAFAVWLLLRARRFDRNEDWFVAGIALGMIALVRASAAPTIGMALFWCLVWGASGSALARLRKTVLVALAVLAMVAPGWSTLQSDRHAGFELGNRLCALGRK